MAEATYILRTMIEDDFNEVHALWMSIHGFGIRSIDDSEENVKRFIRRKSGHQYRSVYGWKNRRSYSLRTGWKKRMLLSCMRP